MSDDKIQLILVVESKKSAKTDSQYIRKLIMKLFDKTISDKDIKLSDVFMCGKSNYNKRSTIKQINDWKKYNAKGINYIIYFFDTDNVSDPTWMKKLSDEVIPFCSANKYEFVWFSYDIEDVFLQKQIEDKKKLSVASKYKIDDYFKKISPFIYDQNSTNQYFEHHSNIILVLNQIFNPL